MYDGKLKTESEYSPPSPGDVNLDHGRETIRQKIRDEIKKSLEKENILSAEDKILIKSFIEKINNELR